MSTGPQRDEAVERMVRQALRDAGGRGGGACPEPELLAAFVEQRLQGPERLALESHLASCAGCQEALAIAAQDDAAAQPAIAVAGRRPVRWVWRWLAPAAAVAMMAVVYVAVRSGSVDQATAPASSPHVMAQKSDVGGGQPVNEAAGAADALGAAREEKAERLAAVPVQEPSRGSGAGAPPAAEAAVKAAAEHARPAAAPPVPPRPAGRMAAAPAPTGVAGAAPGAVTAERQTMAAADEAPRTQAVIAGRAAPPSAAVTVVASEKATGERMAAARTALTATTPVLVASPGAESVWRIGEGGFLARSTDAGKTWQPQNAGVIADLTAGHALSASVCWVVGKTGTVLLTTDGEHWVSRSLPEPVDLKAVEAVDALTATVTAPDGRRFATTDGGITWRGTKDSR